MKNKVEKLAITQHGSTDERPEFYKGQFGRQVDAFIWLKAIIRRLLVEPNFVPEPPIDLPETQEVEEIQPEVKEEQPEAEVVEVKSEVQEALDQSTQVKWNPIGFLTGLTAKFRLPRR